MAKTKAERRRTAERRIQHPQKKAASHIRVSKWLWPAIVAAVAAGAFLIAKQQAQGPGEAVAPPPAGLPDTPDYHSLLVDPADPQRVVLGTHAGLYESTDGGRSWTTAELRGQDAMNLARTPAKTVWAAGHNVLTKSEDGGETWQDVRPDGLPGLDLHGFAADPGNANRLYAAVAGAGLFVSVNGGEAFDAVSTEVGPSVFGLAVTPEGRILAADPGRGLLASDDDGSTWRLAYEGSVAGVAVSPADPQTILATGPGILLSTDGGATWRQVQTIAAGAGPVAWAPSDPSVAYVVGFDRTLYRTDDGGETWHAVT